MNHITYSTSPQVTNTQLNLLFANSWPDYSETDFRPVLEHSLVYICAFQGDDLIGYVNVAWDGGVHGFVLDTTVHPHLRRQGIGVQLVHHAAAEAERRGIEWLHVDYEPHLEGFYQRCGFVSSKAGVMRLGENNQQATANNQRFLAY